ncbi:MAG: hypothetical protein ABIX00_00995 [Polaromonas sp.]
MILWRSCSKFGAFFPKFKYFASQHYRAWISLPGKREPSRASFKRYFFYSLKSLSVMGWSRILPLKTNEVTTPAFREVFYALPSQQRHAPVSAKLQAENCFLRPSRKHQKRLI